MTLEASNISISFDGVRALNSVSARIESGVVTAIVGPNGAGKTTLINILSGFLRPDAGQIFLHEHEIGHKSADAISRAGIVRTFQGIGVIDRLSPYQNIELSTDDHWFKNPISMFIGWHQVRHTEQLRPIIMRWLTTVGLQDYAYNSTSSLSYGQKKLLSIACTLACNPSFLLLDEPAAGLDPMAQKKAESVISQARERNCGIALIDHNLDFVRRVADNVLFLDRGEIILQGKPQEVLQDSRVWEAFLGKE